MHNYPNDYREESSLYESSDLFMHEESAGTVLIAKLRFTI